MGKENYTRQGDNIASEVTVIKDPSIINTQNKKRFRTREEKLLDLEYAKQQKRDQSGGKLAKMGFESGLGKDERKFELKSLINKKKVITLQSGMQAMGLSKGTIITYAKELELQLWDPEDNKFVGAKNGQRVGLDI